MEKDICYCESCLYACPWDYTYNKIMCSRNFEEREPFDISCEFYIPEKDKFKQRVLKGDTNEKRF